MRDNRMGCVVLTYDHPCEVKEVLGYVSGGVALLCAPATYVKLFGLLGRGGRVGGGERGEPLRWLVLSEL